MKKDFTLCTQQVQKELVFHPIKIEISLVKKKVWFQGANFFLKKFAVTEEILKNKD